MPDLVIRNAHTPYHEGLVDIAIVAGRVSAIRATSGPGGGPAGGAGSGVVGPTPAPASDIDARGRLVTPPFVDAHFHLDAVLTRIANRTGTLAEGIANWALYKSTRLTVDDVHVRATEYLERAISNGIQAIRSHVDVCDPELRGVEALLEVRKEFRDRIDIQLVAFPQDGLYSDDSVLPRLENALDRGLDVVGGIPHNERSAMLGSRSITTLLEIAAERGLPVDMHCDETDDPASRHVEHLAAETIRLGLQGSVTASHVTSIATMDPYYVSRRLIPLMAEAKLNVIANPMVNVHLGGRFSHPSHRAMTPVKQHLAAGLAVACGQDCNEDPWYPLGNADMLEVARMGAHLGHMMGLDELHAMYRTVTDGAARIIGLEGYGLAEGDRANLVILEAPSVFESIRTSPARAVVIRDGRVVRSTGRG